VRIGRGEQLTTDNPALVKRWNRIKELQSQWLKEVAEPEIEARRRVTLGVNASEHFEKISERTLGQKIFKTIREKLESLELKFKNENNLSGMESVANLKLDMLDMEASQRGFLLTGAESSLEPFLKVKLRLKNRLNKLSNLTETSIVTAAEVDSFKSKVAEWIENVAQPEIEARFEMNRFPVGLGDVTEMMRSGKGEYYMDEIDTVLDEIMAEQREMIERRSDEQMELSFFAKNLSIFGTLIATLFGIIIAVYLVRGIVRPIKDTKLILKDIAEGQGDLTKRVSVLTKDEIGEMGSYFNAFIEKLQLIISEVVGSTTQLATAAEELAQISVGSSENLSRQNKETTNVATSINHMASALEEVASHTESATYAATNADHEVKEGNAMVHQTLESVRSLAEDIESSTAAMNELKSKSLNIGSVLDVIRGIAEQTNLLALNAAIEAARAGEGGRGFAVVADEVRALARRTQDSTSEIEVIISELQKGAEDSVASLQESNVKSDSTLAQAKETGRCLTSVSNAVSTIQEMSAQIASSVQEQSATTQEVNANVTRIQAISEETFTGAEQASLASQEVARLSSNLQELVRNFKVS
jgi:methyl-accepting chemotaxis protein